MLHGVPALLAYLDLQQRVLFANHPHRAWLGVEPDELIGRRAIEVLGKRTYQSALPALQSAYAGQPATFEGMLFRAGEPRYVHGNFQPDIGAERPRLWRVCRVGRHHRAAHAGAATARKRTALLRRFPARHHRHGADQIHGRFLRVNAAICSMLGYTEAELLALDIRTVSHPDDVATDLDLLQQMLRGEREVYQVEKRNLHKDGHTVHLQLSVSLVRDPQGAPLYLVTQAQDISRRKAFEDALHRERELAQVTLRSIGDAVLTTDPQLRVTSLNPVAEAMTGWSAAEARGRPVEEVFPVRHARTRRYCPARCASPSRAMASWIWPRTASCVTAAVSPRRWRIRPRPSTITPAT